MRTRYSLFFVSCLISTLIGCSADDLIDPDQSVSGEFTLLTYNVAGLPQGISQSNPEKNIPLISAPLNSYDIVLVQEDFFYHQELKARTKHTFQSEPKAAASEFTSGDGLNRFSIFPFRAFLRQPWEKCSNQTGNDCLANKGFSVAETEVAPGVVVDIYNLHMDAGGRSGDLAARAVQIAQLLRTINSRSSGKAVIVAGDFNLNLVARSQDIDMFEDLLGGSSLIDACRSLSCGTELVDRVLFQSGGEATLDAISWQTAREFVDEDGNPLSDHHAVAVKIRWQRERD